jgi:hypothetical protein
MHEVSIPKSGDELVGLELHASEMTAQEMGALMDWSVGQVPEDPNCEYVQYDPFLRLGSPLQIEEKRYDDQEEKSHSAVKKSCQIGHGGQIILLKLLTFSAKNHPARW